MDTYMLQFLVFVSSKNIYFWKLIFRKYPRLLAISFQNVLSSGIYWKFMYLAMANLLGMQRPCQTLSCLGLCCWFDCDHGLQKKKSTSFRCSLSTQPSTTTNHLCTYSALLHRTSSLRSSACIHYRHLRSTLTVYPKKMASFQVYIGCIKQTKTKSFPILQCRKIYWVHIPYKNFWVHTSQIQLSSPIFLSYGQNIFWT